ncbi:MAG: hypothetical protein K2I46_05895 [Clostridia bacterium]|nr:hypothetical protein [Clostridia bacterium]MDE6471568.1 hypothetical protein [Clostridia bacterium]
MKEKLKSYEFWVSIVSAVMVVLQSLSLKFDLPYIQETVMGFLGILAVAGIVKKSDPPTGSVDAPTEDTSTEEAQETEESK